MTTATKRTMLGMATTAVVFTPGDRVQGTADGCYLFYGLAGVVESRTDADGYVLVRFVSGLPLANVQAIHLERV